MLVRIALPQSGQDQALQSPQLRPYNKDSRWQTNLLAPQSQEGLQQFSEKWSMSFWYARLYEMFETWAWGGRLYGLTTF